MAGATRSGSAPAFPAAISARAWRRGWTSASLDSTSGKFVLNFVPILAVHPAGSGKCRQTTREIVAVDRGARGSIRSVAVHASYFAAAYLPISRAAAHENSTSQREPLRRPDAVGCGIWQHLDDRLGGGNLVETMNHPGTTRSPIRLTEVSQKVPVLPQFVAGIIITNTQVHCLRWRKVTEVRYRA